MILITGARGQVGGALLAQLAGHVPGVRALTRRPAALDMPPGVDVVAGDAGDAAGLDPAFRGVERAFLMSAEPVSTAEPRHVPNLVAAAQRAGVRQIVLLSVADGGAGTDVLGRWWRRIEASVTGSGMEWTLLRPGRFMSNALAWAPAIRRGDEVPIPVRAARGRPDRPGRHRRDRGHRARRGGQRAQGRGPSARRAGAAHPGRGTGRPGRATAPPAVRDRAPADRGPGRAGAVRDVRTRSSTRSCAAPRPATAPEPARTPSPGCWAGHRRRSPAGPSAISRISPEQKEIG